MLRFVLKIYLYFDAALLGCFRRHRRVIAIPSGGTVRTLYFASVENTMDIGCDSATKFDCPEFNINAACPDMGEWHSGSAPASHLLENDCMRSWVQSPARPHILCRLHTLARKGVL